MPSMSTWHTFAPSSDDDNECTAYDCGVIVSDDALRAYAGPCPAPACDAPGNTGACVFVPGEHGPECAYCERPGYRDTDVDDDLDDDDETAA